MVGGPEGTAASLDREIARLERRDRQLSGLLSSARALVQIDDVDTLLQELVDRAYGLMGVDLTYLSAYDEATGDLWVRASRGAVSQILRRLRVPAGAGLASRVVETQAAQWTTDYPHADLRAHDAVSAAVEAEGMRSLLGVPMLAEGQVLGVLFTADRYVHEFTPDEVALLTAFADHAAVVLHRARLFAAVEDSAARAEQAQARAEQRAAEMERAAQIHEELTSLVLGGEGPGEVCRALATALGREVAAVRPDASFWAGHRDDWWDDRDRLLPGPRAALEESTRTARAVAAPQDRGSTVVSVAVASGTPIVGLVVGGEDPPSPLELRTVERAGQVLALLVVQQEARLQAEEMVRGELAADLVAGRGSAAMLRQRAESQGITLAPAYVPVAVPVSPARRRSTRQHLASVAPRLLATDAAAGLTVLLAADSPETAEDTSGPAALRRHLGSAAGLLVVGQATPVAELAGATAQVWRLAELLPRLGVTEGDATVAAFAPYLAMFGNDAPLAQAFVEAVLGDLLRRDREVGSDLVRTLAAYLDANGNLRRTGEALFVHVNTVKQRLARIGTVIGDDWRDPEMVFRLRVALRLHEAGESVTTHPRA